MRASLGKLRHTQHGITYFGTKNISNMEEIQKGEDFVRSLIRKATVETNQLYYMEGFNVSSSQRRYGWVQCSRDLSNEGCRQCLEAMLAEYPKCCEQKLGWMVWCQSCLIRYEDHIFYQLNQKVAPSVGRSFSWFRSNRKAKSCINRFLISKEWIDVW